MKWSAAVGLLTVLTTCAAYAAAEHQASPARVNEPQKSLSEQGPIARAGQAIYMDDCSACHNKSGAGLSGLFPPLKASPLVQARDPSTIIRLVLEGGKSPATGHVPTGTAMPAFGWKLSDKEVAAVLTYVRSSWGNAAQSVSAGEVGKVRQKACTGVEARLHLQPSFDYFCKQ